METYKQAPVIGSRRVDESAEGSRAKVYFTRVIDAAHLISLYARINDAIYGKVAIKLHRGTLQVNGWTFCPVDIMDEEGTIELPVRGGKHFKTVSMGSHIVNYDSMIVLTHFKGHAMGGFGGSMKNLAIGCADGRIGKSQVHGVDVNNQPEDWNAWPGKELLMENMAESAKATIDLFGKHIVYLNVLRRMSVDCDCAGLIAAEPTIPDIGILASTDLLAIDQASVDLVYQTASNQDLVKRIESRHGLHQLTAMKDLKMGNPQYELVEVE